MTKVPKPTTATPLGSPSVPKAARKARKRLEDTRFFRAELRDELTRVGIAIRRSQTERAHEQDDCRLRPQCLNAAAKRQLRKLPCANCIHYVGNRTTT
jgi:hypothetical protein